MDESEYEIQSSEAPSDFVSAIHDSQQLDAENVGFIDNTGGEILDLGHNENDVALVDGTPDVTLGQFLGRPTLIKNIAWSMSDVPSVLSSFNPWYEFFNNAKIKKKIDNYAFIKCRLHVKVMLNASPFMYGMGIMNYNPIEGITWNPVRASTSFAVDQVSYSQFPHIKIYPASSSGGEMTLPFLYHKNWLALTSAQDLQDMGTMRFIPYTTLKSSNGATGQTVNLQIYAWAENVELMGPTVKLAVQGDEYDGVISKPASTVARFAQNFENLPVIGRFAKATTLGANAVSAIAHLFGFTNTPIIDPIHALIPMNAPNMASAECRSQIQKLTLDPKQELTVDPSVHGLPGIDELSMNHIKVKESFLTKVTWSTSDAIDTQLFNARVTPTLNTQNVETGAVRIAQVPMGYIANLFQYWRGDIIFRFKFVCTKFHKGRVRITYDPVGRIDTDADSQNVAFTQIVDIGEDNDVEVTVPYHQAAAWLRFRSITDSTWSAGGTLAPDNLYENGLITLRVQNYLNAPTTSGSIDILIFVRGGQNLEYDIPASSLARTSFFSVQGDEHDSVSLEPTKVVAGDTHQNAHENRYLLNMGEACKSLRNLLHRHSLAEVITWDNASTTQYSEIFQQFMAMPINYGFDPSGIESVTGIVSGAEQSFNFVPNHPLPYVAMMYKGYRGSINHMYNLDTKQYPYIDDFRVMRDPYNINQTTRKGSIATTLASGATINARLRYLNTSVRPGNGGMALTSQKNNNSLMVQIPDFNRYNFNLIGPSLFTIPGNNDGGAERTYSLSFLAKATNTAGSDTANITINRYVGTGPDFTLLFWQCVPTLDYYNSIPAAA